jgi:membrane dipeptidase
MVLERCTPGHSETEWIKGEPLKNLTLIIVLVFISAYGLFAQSDYMTLHQQSLVVDTHSDVLLQVLRGADISKRLDYGHVDLVRLKEGGVDVQFFAIWPNPSIYGEGGMFNQSIRLIDRLEQIINDNPDKINLARTPDEIELAVKNGKIAACIGVEGGTAIENDLDKLSTFYDRGARYLSLTWNNSPDWASCAKDESSAEFEGKIGLSDFGRKVIQWMNEKGMIVDVSHSGEKTFWDVIAESRKPIIASHSCVYNLCSHYRNLKDDQIRAIGKNGGAIFINFYPGYLVKGFNQKYSALRKSSQVLMDSMEQVYGNDQLGYRKYRNNYLIDGAGDFQPDIGQLVDHIDYIISLIGDDHVGLGSDFDGISIVPRGLDDVSKMPEITRVMMERGYSAGRIKKILGGNFMRIFRDVTGS